jgi:phasin
MKAARDENNKSVSGSEPPADSAFVVKLYPCPWAFGYAKRYKDWSLFARKCKHVLPAACKERENGAVHQIFVAMQQKPFYIKSVLDIIVSSTREDGIATKEDIMTQQIDFEIPSSVRDLASKSVEQAREAYNRFLEASRQAHDVVSKSTDVIASGAREINEKAVKYTEANLQANFELAQRLVHAKDLKEALDIQSQFARQQMETFAQQAQELSRLIAQSAQKANPAGQF